MKKKLKKTGRILLSASLAVCAVLNLSGCDFIIINEMSEASKNSGSSENSELSELHGITQYDPYEAQEDNYSLSMKYLENLPSKDFDGGGVFITTASTEYILPEDAENNVDKRILERNELIEKTYNCSLLFEVTENNTIMYQDVKNAVNSDSYYSDMLLIPTYMLGSYAGYGLIMNLRSVPFLDMSQPYFYQDSVSMSSGSYSTYALSGYATLAPDAFTAVYFNRDMVSEAGLEMPYTYVVNNTWTWEKLLEYDETIQPKNSFLVSSNSSRLADLIFISAGNNYIRSAEKTQPTIGFSVASTKKTIEVCHKVYSDRIVSDNAASLFSDGKALYLIDYLSTLESLTDSKADWGVVPLPAGNDGQSYQTLVSNNELLFSIPKNHTDSESVALIIQALNAASYKYLYEEYVEYNIYHVLHDNDSANMLDIILDSAAFDFAIAFGNSYPTIGQATYLLIRQAAETGDLTSIYGDPVAAAKSTLKTHFGVGG